jgi:hypothetical protein
MLPAVVQCMLCTQDRLLLAGQTSNRSDEVGGSPGLAAGLVVDTTVQWLQCSGHDSAVAVEFLFSFVFGVAANSREIFGRSSESAWCT